MNILDTGAKGFVGKNLCAQLGTIKDGKARNYGGEIVNIMSMTFAVEINAVGDHGVPVLDYLDQNVSSKVVKII